jgi:2-polyprenyl-3-methyl-5-hydroxy-6-metoxy-1,4-benzoquinol methylase
LFPGLKRFFSNKVHHWARGGGERQAASTLDGIRQDHVARYEFALNFLSEGALVLDVGCGVGYGSFILATRSRCTKILAIDIDGGAIRYARVFYRHPKIHYLKADCYKVNLFAKGVDTVICFETIEHLEEDSLFLKKIYEAIKAGGRLVLSAPNQAFMPFDKKCFPFHKRHYLPGDLSRLILDSGFVLKNVFSQTQCHPKEINPGWEGFYNILVCEKV